MAAARLAALGLVLLLCAGVAGGALVISDKEEAQHVARHVMAAAGHRHTLDEIHAVRGQFAALRAAAANHAAAVGGESPPQRGGASQEARDVHATIEDSRPAEQALSSFSASAGPQRSAQASSGAMGLPPAVAARVNARLSDASEASNDARQTAQAAVLTATRMPQGQGMAPGEGKGQQPTPSKPLTEQFREARRQAVLTAGAEPRRQRTRRGRA